MHSITSQRTNVGATPRSLRRSLSSAVAVEHAKPYQTTLIPPPPCLHCTSLLLPDKWREVGTGAPGLVKAPHLTAELISDFGTINPGGASRVALALTLEPGWHVYWVYAWDSGEAPEVQWSAPRGLSMGSIQYAAPSRLPLRPLMDYGYEGTTVFPFDVTVSSQVPPGVVDLKAHVRWLVCREICPPGKA
jgi:DsbC/DsbD-like thiol-disulfide interchange protein